VTKIRRLISRFVGGTQCALGALASVFAFLVYASLSIREAIGITSEAEVYLYMFLSLVFSVFSILSGLFLLREAK
jgi:hypothetical protein